TGQSLGTVAISQEASGLKFSPSLKGLKAGPHGFHVHDKANCAPADKEGSAVAGWSAGPHFDPGNTGKHLGPEGAGHQGDLPVLVAAADGSAIAPVISSKLSLKDLQGRSLMIHAENDNYGDQPGGARIACGIIR
ncbi:MAG: superoxide dismutase [Cu-Zn] SodC2, partial [Gammaproteobacteria bacterium]|nr:superoxide dismutase [Cu-Zn] SodC2 [Gammaproteobacteria bacterium]